MTKTDVTYLVPEIEISVTQSWVRLINYCQETLQYGDLYLKISNAEPSKKIKEVPSIRFDKVKQEQRSETHSYIIQSINMRVSQSWINLIRWCQSYFNSGDLGIQIINAQPAELLQAKQNVNFGKQETIPPGIPLDFNK